MIRLALLLAAGTLVACVTKPAVVETPADASSQFRAADFFPLAVGNAWTYELRSPGQIGSQTVRIESLENGWYRDSMKGSLRHDAHGLRDLDRYLLRDPVQKGTEWSNVESVQSVERHEIVEAGRPCSSKAGTFARCVLVRSTNRLNARQLFVLESTYAEGVGLVSQRTLQEESGRDPVVVLQRELVSYELK